MDNEKLKQAYKDAADRLVKVCGFAHWQTEHTFRAGAFWAEQQLVGGYRKDTQLKPVLYVSLGQLERHTDPDEGEGGRYLPARKTPAGLISFPLYTAPQATQPPAPDCSRCNGSGEDLEGYLTHGRGPDDHTVDGPCRRCDGTGAAPQAPAAPDDVLCYIRAGATLPDRHGFEVCRATDFGVMAVMGDGRAHAMPTVTPAEFAADIDELLAAPAAPAGEVVYRWQALDFSGYCYGSNPPEDLPARCNLTPFYRQPDAYRAAITLDQRAQQEGGAQ